MIRRSALVHQLNVKKRPLVLTSLLNHDIDNIIERVRPAIGKLNCYCVQVEGKVYGITTSTHDQEL